MSFSNHRRQGIGLEETYVTNHRGLAGEETDKTRASAMTNLKQEHSRVPTKRS